jgi:hypothetical protein
MALVKQPIFKRKIGRKPINLLNVKPPKISGKKDDLTLRFSKSGSRLSIMIGNDNPTLAWPISRDEAVALLCFLTDACFEAHERLELTLDLSQKLPNFPLHSGSVFPSEDSIPRLPKRDA